MTVAANNWQPLGSLGLTVDAPTMGTLEFPPFDMLMVQYSIMGYNISDTTGMIFNYDTSAVSNNYGDRHLWVGVGVTTLSNSQTTSATIVRLGGFNSPRAQCGSVYIAARGSISSQVVMTILHNSGSGSAAAVTNCELPAAGSWGGTGGVPEDVYAIEMKTVSGNNILAGSGFAVFGCNGL